MQQTTFSGQAATPGLGGSVRDSGNLTHATFVDVVPRTVTLTLTSKPAGLQLTLDGQPVTTPFSVLGVVGIQRTLGAPASQTRNGKMYLFRFWSDGGAATHTIVTPAINTTYTATYKAQGRAIGGNGSE